MTASPQDEPELEIVHHLEPQRFMSARGTIGVCSHEVERADADEARRCIAIDPRGVGGKRQDEEVQRRVTEESRPVLARVEAQLRDAVALRRGHGARDQVRREPGVGVGEQDPFPGGLSRSDFQCMRLAEPARR